MIIKACPGHPLLLGRLGENLAREIVFVDEVAAWLSEYPNAAIGLLNRRPGDTQGYPVARAVVSGGALHLTVTNTDLSAEGNGRCELVATDNGVVVKSAIYDTIILTALDGSGETPEPWEDWREYFVGLKDEAEGSAEAAAGSATAAGQSATQAGQSAAVAGTFSAAAQAAREGAEAAVSQVTNLQASAETLEPGSDATVQYDAQTGVLTLGIPKGETGAAGPQGDPGEDYVLTAEDKAEIAGMVNVPVTDVQVNGSSIVENGVANVPIAASDTFGVVKVGSGGSIAFNNSNQLKVNAANSSGIKSGTEASKPIAPALQHESAFYGLAKAAGDATQSASSNAVGTYTDEARKAIKKMLGIYDEWELIAEETVDADTENYYVTADISGQPFELKRALIRVQYPAISDTTGLTTKYVSTILLFKTTSGGTGSASCPTLSYQNGYAATFMEFLNEIICNIPYTIGRAGTTSSNAQNVQQSSGPDNISSVYGVRVKQYSTAAPIIPQGTKITIYGIRI